MHKELLCEASTFFKAAFDGGFLEAKDRTVEMSEDDVVTFKHFQVWLYSNKIYSTDETENDIPWEVLTGLYIFAETRGASLLQNAVIDAYVDKQETLHSLPVSEIARVYDFTCENSPLRRFFVDCAAKWMHTDSTWFSDQRFAQYTKEFLYDVVRAQCEVKKGSRSIVGDFKKEKTQYYVAIDA